MSLINIPAFSGLNILAAPQRIRDDEATIAIGCDFRSLDLRPFKGDADTGMGTTDTAGIANGASIFQFDSSHLIIETGEKSFARSPTFFSDSTTDPRVFVADNTSDATYIQTLSLDPNLDGSQSDSNLTAIAGKTDSYTIANNTKRLGVPKPAAINMAKVKADESSGNLNSIELSSYKGVNAKVRVPVAVGANMAVGQKLLIECPGLAPNTYRVIASSPVGPVNIATLYDITLANTQLKWKSVRFSKDGTKIVFRLAGHGFYGGEQVLFSHLNSGQTGPSSVWPSDFSINKVFRVINPTVDTFQLEYYSTTTSAWKTLEFTSAPGSAGPWEKKISVIATTDYGFADPSAVTVQLTQVTNQGYQASVSFTFVPDDQIATWTYAEDAGAIVDRSYVVTYVNAAGDESEPSEPTKVLPVVPGNPVNFNRGSIPVAAANSGNALADYPSITKVRLYRTDATGTFRLVTTEENDDKTLTWAEVSTAIVDPATDPPLFIDTYQDTELGEPLSTQGWSAPSAGIKGLINAPNGVIAGFKGRTIAGSVPFAPYAWPLANKVATDYDVVGLVSTSSGIVIITQGMPAILIGDDPGTWSMQKLEYPYGCVSRKSIVDLGEMAIYASADGLVGIAGANVEILTKDVMTRAQWQSLYNPSAIRAGHVEGRYYGVSKVGNDYKAFMFDPRTRSFIDLTVGGTYPVALYSRLTDDTLLILKSDGKVYAWNRSANWVEYTWQSKWFRLAQPDVLGCGQIYSPSIIENFSLLMVLYGWGGDGPVEICRYTTGTPNVAAKIYPFVDNVNPFRLPVANDYYSSFMVYLQGTMPISQVTLASTIGRLKEV